jgi:hypothetical protein
MSIKDIKLELYTGKNKIPINNWLNLFEVVIDGLTNDKDKNKRLISYLADDAFEFYATDIASKISRNSWDETRALMESRFGICTIPPILAATRRRLLKVDTIQTYYEDKMVHLKRTGLNDKQMSDLLTEGLPDHYRHFFFGNRVKIPLEWLALATEVEADKTLHQRLDHKPHKSSHSNHCTIHHCDGATPPDGESPKPNGFTPRPKSKSFKKGDKSKSPCHYCKLLGQTEWHWHKDCPNKSSDSGAAKDITPEAVTNCVDSHSNLMASAVRNFITIPAIIGDIRFKVALVTTSTIHIMSVVIAKQHNLKVNTKEAIRLQMANGYTHTVGTVTFKLTIGTITHTIKAPVLRGFKYRLLLGTDIGKNFPIQIDLEKRTAVLNTK